MKNEMNMSPRAVGQSSCARLSFNPKSLLRMSSNLKVSSDKAYLVSPTSTVLDAGRHKVICPPPRMVEWKKTFRKRFFECKTDSTVLYLIIMTQDSRKKWNSNKLKRTLKSKNVCFLLQGESKKKFRRLEDCGIKSM